MDNIAISPEVKPDWLAVRDRVVAGEREAFTGIVVAFQARVRAFLAVRLADRVAVDDLAQETFLTAFARFPDFRGDSSLATWLCGIAHNHLRNHLRQRQHQPLPDRLATLLSHSVEAAAERFDSAALVKALATCVQSLEPDQRALVDERFVRGESLADICRRRGLKHSALTMALHRLRFLLQNCARKRLALGRQT